MSKERVTHHEEESPNDAALAALREWLLAAHIPGKDVGDVIERVRDFYANAFGLLGFPPAIGISAAKGRKQSVGLHVLWPAAITRGHQHQAETGLRELFQRDVSDPLRPRVSCHLDFLTHHPDEVQQYAFYLGPSPGGYETFAQQFITLARAVKSDPSTVRQMKALIDTLPGKTDEQKREIITRVHALESTLRPTD